VNFRFAPIDKFAVNPDDSVAVMIGILDHDVSFLTQAVKCGALPARLLHVIYRLWRKSHG